MMQALEHSINVQRASLNNLLSHQLKESAHAITPLLHQPEELLSYLRTLFHRLKHCKYIYILDRQGVQTMPTINRYGADDEPVGRNRSQRPYMTAMFGQEPAIDFSLSEAYISRNKKRPSLTAIQRLTDDNGKELGFLGVDYDLRELPHSEVIYEEPSQWRQIKGDPAIRQGLFQQQRVESLMDQHIDTVLSVHKALMLDQGVYHFQLHFSSSRSTIWHRDDPYIYRILTINELADSNICLAYPRRAYLQRAIVPTDQIIHILNLFKELRFADETIYLRSASLNIVNGKIGLNFSCDGTHYLNFDEFLANGLDFWFGGKKFPQAVVPAEKVALDHHKMDEVIEQIAAQGCMQVNKLLASLKKAEVPELLSEYSTAECDFIYHELKSIMAVYEGGVCHL